MQVELKKILKRVEFQYEQRYLVDKVPIQQAAAEINMMPNEFLRIYHVLIKNNPDYND